MNKLLQAWMVAGLAIGVTSVVDRGRLAHADSYTTGSLRGIVKDKTTGEPSVGATVVATSSALQGEQVVIADDKGGYYITALPPGIYTLMVYYNDTKFSRGNVLVQVNKEAVVNIAIDTSAGKGETITISGTAPIVDQGSTKIDFTITQDYTKNVPTQRTFGEVMGAAAGAQSDRYGVSFAGATSAENTFVVEGLNTTDTGFGTLSSNLPNEFVQETEVITGGYNAEFGRSTGAIVNVVTKSGSNEFHGSVFGHLQPSQLTAGARTILREGNAIDNASNLDSRWDLGAELGGPIVKDKLWFHVGFTPMITHQTTARFVNRNVDKVNNRTGMAAPNGDGVPDVDPSTGFTVREQVAKSDLPEEMKTYYFTAKLTGAFSSNHQWQISAFGNPEDDEQLLDLVKDPAVRDPASTRQKIEKGAYDVSGKWTSKFGDGKTQLDVVAGFHNGYKNASPLTASTDVPSVQYNYTRSLYDFADLEGANAIAGCHDSLNNQPTADDPYPNIMNCPVSGYFDRGVGFLEQRTNNRISAVLAVTHRVRLLGQHVLKLGADTEFSTYSSRRRYSGGAFLASGTDMPDPGNMHGPTYTVQQYLRSDPNGTVPCGNAMCSVIPGLNANTSDRSIAGYIQDQWQILPNLTINAGVRWEQQVGYVADFLQHTISRTGEELPEIGFQLDNLIAPRIGFIYDPTQEGKSKLFGHWGRFYENIPMDLNVRQFGGETLRSTDLGQDNSCPLDHGAAGAADIGNAIISNCPPGQTTALGAGITYVPPGMEGQYTEELIVGAEYELVSDFTIGVNYVHRTLPVVIEDMSTDGGQDYLIGNPSRNYDAEAVKLERQAEMMTDENLAALYRSRASQLRAIKSFDPPSRNYDALQVTARKRPTSNSLIQASYTYARAKGNYPGLFSTETNQLDPNITSMYDLQDLMPNRYGPNGLDRPHNLKIDGFYQWNFRKLGILVTGVSFRAQSGIPHNTLAAHPVYQLDESYLLPRGALYRSPTTTQLDTHISYGRAIGKTTRLEGFVDIFNLLDQQDELNVDERYTADVALPIVGGDANDLLHAKRHDRDGRQSSEVVVVNKNYGKTSVRQTPLSCQIGFRLTF